jgi:hypothetical protein
MKRFEVDDVLILGVNTWEREMPKQALIAQALKFAEMVKANGIAELQDFWLAHDRKLLWCTWKTENLQALQAAFAEMNRQSGLKSELIPFEKVPFK